MSWLHGPCCRTEYRQYLVPGFAALRHIASSALALGLANSRIVSLSWLVLRCWSRDCCQHSRVCHVAGSLPGFRHFSCRSSAGSGATVSKRCQFVMCGTTPSVVSGTCMRKNFRNILLRHYPTHCIVLLGIHARYIAITAAPDHIDGYLCGRPVGGVVLRLLAS